MNTRNQLDHTIVSFNDEDGEETEKATVYDTALLLEEERNQLKAISDRLTTAGLFRLGTESDDLNTVVIDRAVFKIDDISPSEQLILGLVDTRLKTEKDAKAVERKPTVGADDAEETPDDLATVPSIGNILDAPEPKASRQKTPHTGEADEVPRTFTGIVDGQQGDPPTGKPAQKPRPASVSKGTGSNKPAVVNAGAPAKAEHTLPPDDGPQPPMLSDAVQPEPASPPPIGAVKPTAQTAVKAEVEDDSEEDPDAESPTEAHSSKDLKSAVNEEMLRAAAEAAKSRPVPVVVKPQTGAQDPWETNPAGPNNGQQNQTPDPNATQAQFVDQPAGSAPPVPPVITIPQGGSMAVKQKKGWPWKSVLGGIMMILLLIGAGSLMVLGLVTASGGVYWYKTAPSEQTDMTTAVDADPPAEAPEVNLPPAVPDEPVPHAPPVATVEVPHAPPVTFATMNVAGSYPEGSGMCANVIIKGEVATKAGREDLTICGDSVTVKGGTVKVGDTTLTAAHFMEGITGQKGPALQDFKILGANVYCSGDAPACTPK